MSEDEINEKIRKQLLANAKAKRMKPKKCPVCSEELANDGKCDNPMCTYRLPPPIGKGQPND